MMAGRKRQRNPASYLSDDLLIEILVRLPPRPLGRFKCVSRSWRDLISGPVHRRRLAHTDAASGFFYHVHGDGYRAPVTTDLNFTALCPPDGGGGSPPAFLDQAFPFLPSSSTRTRTELLDSCNGLLLLRCHRPSGDELAAPHYIVCNPATQGWAVELPVPLPEPSRARNPFELGSEISRRRRERQQRRESTRPAALAFDPAVSPHFHVFELVEDDGRPSSRYGGAAVKAVRIYSSETGEWVLRNSEWSYRIAYAGENAYFNGGEWSYRLAYAGKHAYLNGSLHLTTTDTEKGMVVVASVDTKGQTWRATRVCPEPPATLGAPGVTGQSQRRLLYVDASSAAYARDLSVYALEDCGGGGGAERWILKHRARSLDPSGGQSVVAIHPGCNVIFLFDSRRRSLIAYDMDHGTTRVVHSFTDATSNYHFFPYVPLYLQ
ncbi:hypothetical protein PAHAL_5G018100 [Panicum hallii]|jgi:hypothetical protein|uniref:F-box domain-containing protein n=2 Tax=Panicum hallii TaxID=206008 RepID=A0A2T8IIK3_9POAL|nr:hypothetical protein PAHAL_5G018100 [Panicum hallii]